jgi:hypothetical protein
MKRKALRIAITFAVGIVWAVIPYLIGPISAFQSIAYAIAAPGVKIGGLIFGQEIKHSLTIAPISMAINFLIAACVVYVGASILSSGAKRNGS